MSMNPSAAMMVASILGVGGDALAASTTAGAQAAQGKSAQEAAEFNARMLEARATDAIERGEFQAARVRVASKGAVSGQRASYAAQGVQVDTGSAADVSADTIDQAEQDIHQTKINAWRESWGLKTQAEGERQQGAYARMAGEQGAANTMLVGGLRVLGGGVRAYGDWAGGRKPTKWEKNELGFNLPTKKLEYR